MKAIIKFIVTVSAFLIIAWAMDWICELPFKFWSPFHHIIDVWTGPLSRLEFVGALVVSFGMGYLLGLIYGLVENIMDYE